MKILFFFMSITSISAISYLAYEEENIIKILNTLELDGHIRIPRNVKKDERIQKALEQERNIDLIKTSKEFRIFSADDISEQFEKTISQIDPEITKNELKIRETYRKRRLALRRLALRTSRSKSGYRLSHER